MATAYASVVSLMHLMEQIQLYHARQPIFLEEHLRQIESLQERVSFFQDFLVDYPHGGGKEVEYLERRIIDATYAAEDIIETHLVNFIHAWKLFKKKRNGNRSIFPSTINWRSNYSQRLQSVIEEVDFIKKDAMKNKEKSRLDDHQLRDIAHVSSLGPPLIGNDNMVGFDEDLYQIMDKLTQSKSSLQIIPMTGMGGIGKTTLAKNAYDHKAMVEHFDLRGWITISQVYNERDLLLGLLCGMGYHANKKERENYNYHELGLKLHKYLLGRRYLIVMDDMWSIEIWDTLKLFFPDTKMKSRIIVTTRLSKVANILCTLNLYKMNFLDEDKSWSLLCQKVFSHEGCPRELEEVGKKIAKNCKGLPLSIVVIGGLLAKSEMTREYWECVAEHTSATVNSEDDERCLKVLCLSYNSLPIHLKPCFLHLGVFPEDRDILVSELIKLWVVGGFLRPHSSKSLEEIAKDYLKDLIDRNLILVSKLGYTGNIKYCKIHDLLKDFCLREAEKERFLCVTNAHSTNILRAQCRNVIYPSTSNDKENRQFLKIMQPTSFVRSLTCHFGCDLVKWVNTRLLRVLEVPAGYYREDLFQLVNTRYIRVRASSWDFKLPSSMYLLWNLQVLIIRGSMLKVVAPSEIWKMPQLRHLMIDGIFLPDPPDGRMDDILLENLQTLSCVHNFRCTEEIVKRIPNIKKLKISYPHFRRGKGFSHYCLNNLGRLNKLQILVCLFPTAKYWPSRNDLLQNLEFPHSLKKLVLSFCRFDWEDMTTKIGLLPNLEKLKLIRCFRGEKWNPVEGQFLRLKFLQIQYCYDLVDWVADSSHFPSLECLVLNYIKVLKEIPSGIGDIATLRLIQLNKCNGSVVASAKGIIDEQRNFGNEDLHLVVVQNYAEEP